MRRHHPDHGDEAQTQGVTLEIARRTSPTTVWRPDGQDPVTDLGLEVREDPWTSAQKHGGGFPRG